MREFPLNFSARFWLVLITLISHFPESILKVILLYFEISFVSFHTSTWNFFIASEIQQRILCYLFVAFNLSISCFQFVGYTQELRYNQEYTFYLSFYEVAK